MNPFKRTFALGALALALGGIGTANAQWVPGGPSPLGGTIFQGSGNTGPLSTTTSPALTAGGGDEITLNLGGFATASGMDTIIINGPNNTLTTYGTIQGASGYNAIDLNNSNQIITNWYNILGGNGHPDTGSGGGDGGYAIEGNFGGDLNNISIRNNGNLNGGLGGAGAGHGGGDGGYAIYFDSGGSISGFSLMGIGNIHGGNGGSDPTLAGGSGGYGVYLYANTNLSQISMNYIGNIQGGNGGNGNAGGYGASGGYGIYMTADGGSITGVNLSNGGMLMGGAGGDNGAGNTSSYGGQGGYGLDVYANTSITNFNLVNTNTIAGGAGGNATNPAGGGYGIGGYGVYVEADGGDLNGFSLNNSGKILGGAGGFGGYYTSPAGYGLSVYADGSISNVMLTNSNLIAGGNGGSSNYVNGYGYYGNGGYGIDIEADSGSLSYFKLINSGKVLGGAGAYQNSEYSSPGGYAIYLYADTDISHMMLKNTGSVLGGAGGDGVGAYGYGYGYGTGGAAIYVGADTGNVSDFALKNGTGGSIVGGNGGISNYESGAGGNAFELYASENISKVKLYNGIGGWIVGGNSGDASGVYATSTGDAGYGIYVVSDNGNLDSLSLKNRGWIIGGNGGNILETAFNYDEYGGDGATAVYISADNAISNLCINNHAFILGGNGGSVVGPYAYYPGSGGAGIEIDATSITGLSIMNQAAGLIAGGNGGTSVLPGEEGDGGDGIDIYSSHITNFSFNNQGELFGGSGGANGGYGGDALYIDPPGGVLFNVNIENDGVMVGGAGHGAGYTGGEAIDLRSSSNTLVFINNNGVLLGGNSDPGTTAGIGVKLVTNGVFLNNTGAISAGAGLNLVAIQISGNNNVVNLLGHSSVNGLISATGNAGNVLNIAFSGMSPAAQAALITQLLAQGDLTNFTGTFTVRGVTYNIDPMAIQLHLTSYQLQGQTPNQIAIGINLDSLTYNPAPGTPFFNLLNAIDQSGNVPAALEALSPQKYEIYGDLAIENATAFVQNIDARLNNLRDGSESVDTTGMGGGITSGAITTGDPSKDGDGKGGKGVIQPAPEENRWGFFATGDGLFLRDNTQNIDGQSGKSNSVGTLAGVDGKVGEHAILGTFFAYNNADAILGGDGSHATVESYSGGLYGSYHDDGFYANSLAAYTRNNYSSHRNILIPGFTNGAEASTNGNQATVNLDGGYDWKATSRLTAGPILGLQYVHLDVDGFNESAGGGSLAVGSQSMDSLQSRLGARVDYHIATTATSSFAAELYAAWQHEYLNDSRSINASFEGTSLGAFGIQTASPLRDAAVVGASLNFTFHNRLTLFADYELQLWQASSFEQTINGGAKISF